MKRLFNDGVNHEMSVAPDGRWLSFTHQRMNRPPEIRRFALGERAAAAVTHANDETAGEIALREPESVTVTGAGGTPVQMWILKPPGFDAAKKYPLVFWVHGGPQSAFLGLVVDRWNAQLWAAQGYVSRCPIRAARTGFGQKFTDEISRRLGRQGVSRT